MHPTGGLFIRAPKHAAAGRALATPLILSFLVSLLIGLAAADAADLREVLTDYTVTSWNRKDGLPPGSIWSTAQDADGYLWIATDAGLYRFDGVRFVQWTPLSAKELPHLSVRTVHVSRDRAVWVGYGDGGITRIEPGDARTYGEQDGLPRGAVSVIVEDHKGGLWAGTGRGLFTLAGERWEKLPENQGLPDSPVLSAYVNERDDMVVGTGAGVFKRPAGSDRFQRLETPQQGIARSLSEDSSGRLHVTDAIVGVRLVGDESPHGAFSSQRGRGYRLLHDHRGNLWVGTLGQGLWRMSARQQAGGSGIEKVTALTGLGSDGVLSLMEDREGNLWVGTSEGLSRLVPRKITQITNLGLVSGVEVNADGSVWVGTVDELMRFSASNLEAPLSRLPLKSTRLRTMHANRDTLWAATDAYVGHLARNGSVLSPLRSADLLNQIDLMTTDRHGDLWVYGRGAVRRWSKDRLYPVALPDSLQGRRIVEMYGDTSGRVWVALNDGAIGYASDHSFSLFGPKEGFEAGASRAIYEDQDGVIWIAGAAGLSRFSNGRFDSLTRNKGFPLDNLTAVIDDAAQNLWIGSNVGIMRVERGEFDKALADRQHMLQYTLYDRNDGIAGTPLASYSTGRPATRAGDGRLWFVTGGGLTVIDPHAMASPVAVAPVRIEQVVADETRMTAGAAASLPPRTSRLQIDYTVVNLTTPFRTNFRYRLEGFDTDWIDAGTRRQAFYTNLPPRKYRFSLVASNSEGTPLSSATWDFSIVPMFYQTTWFYGATATVLLAALWGTWRLRLRRVRKDFAILLGERTRLSREIHDTLLQSLVGVALQFEAVAGDVASSSPATRAQFVRLRKRVEQSIREARQSIWNLRSPSLERRDLATALQEFGEEATSSTDVGFELSVEGTPRQRPPAIEEQLLRIGQEAIINAVRHARARAIKVELTYTDDTLILHVSDDGSGFNVERQSEELSGHYGLISMKERAGEAGGTLKVASSESGTQITLVVPMSRPAWKASHADA